MTVETLRVEDSAPWVTPEIEDSMSLPTTHLPESVVKHPFRLMLDVRTVKDQPRMGGYWVSLNWDGAMNPGDLTSEDRQYIMGALEFALEHLKDSQEWDA